MLTAAFMETGDNAAGGSGTDRISALPDDLIYKIFAHLDCAHAAARTAVLSRRWRHLWAHQPELRICSNGQVTSAVAIADGALAGYSAPTLSLLKINVTDDDFRPAHVAPWLRFASQRVAGEVIISMSGTKRSYLEKLEQLDLPVCGMAKKINASLFTRFWLRPPQAGTFGALTSLTIRCCTMDGGEMGRLVSTQCPRLEELNLAVDLVAERSHVSFSSGSLRRLRFTSFYNTWRLDRLDVDAPELRFLRVSGAREARITAPKLEEAEHTYDMDRYEYAQLGRHLRRLHIINLGASTMAGFIQRFDTIGELNVDLAISSVPPVYFDMFVKEARKIYIPDCEVLHIRSVCKHRLVPTMVPLLSRFVRLRKLAVDLHIRGRHGGSLCSCLSPDGPCADNIKLDHLEEIKLENFSGLDEQVEFVKLLLGCNLPLLGRVVFTIPSSCLQETQEIIRNEIYSTLCQDKIMKVRFEIQRY